MADRKANRKRKGKVVFSSSQVVPRFKTLYHEAHFNSTLSARRILPKLILQADENVFNPIRFQIHQRKWEKFTKPIQAIGHLMVKELYANAWEPDKAKRKPYTYTSTVRGTDVSFAPSNIKRVLKLRKDPSLSSRGLCSFTPSSLEKISMSRRLLLSKSTTLCGDARIPAIPDDTLIPQKPPIIAEAMVRTREAREKNPRQARQATPPQQQPPQDQQQPQFQHQQDFSSARQFKEMEMQGIPVTMANLAIHRQREEEINQGRMRYDEILQEAAAQQVREANKGKTREVVPDFEDEFVSSESEEF
ncbi:hypothetical protein PIB30_042148 [Stylosanthes scabra]|uniref:Uncharacterized protein n=1 Tax=Stylosanthes scabra TaxID=79078 RepID=A0ABU6ZDX1_9FABA|nr:hypothetical protein [Stylosanthes scabra]